jgi:Flp pilus assembly protein TadB
MEDLYLETDKQKLEKLENLYEMVMDFEKKSHEKNQKRIRIGLRCLYIIPAIFLFLLMVMKSSKIIFLALWIISLFILAVYLIVVEYMDYNLQNHINKLEGKKNGKVDSLIEMDRFEKNVDRFEEKAGMIEKAVDNAVDRVTSTAKEMMLRTAEKTEETDDKNI